MGDVLRFIRAVTQTGFWTNQEKAELFRLAEEVSGQGAGIETATGISDNGDPWFIVYDAMSGEVLVHVARIAGKFVVHDMSGDLLLEGDDLRRLVNHASGADMVELAKGSYTNNVVVLAAIALVIDFYLNTERAEAAATSVDSMVPFVTTDLAIGHVDVAPPPPDPNVTDKAASNDRSHGLGQWFALPVVGESMIQSVAPNHASPLSARNVANSTTPPDQYAHAPPPPSPVIGPASAVASPLDASVSLSGTAGNDTLVAGSGDDTLTGGGGNDLLIGGDGHDLLIGGDGNDTLIGGEGNDTLDGGAGNDAIVVGAGDLAKGGTGADRFIVTDNLVGQWVARTQVGSNVVFTDSISDFNSQDGDHLSFAVRKWVVTIDSLKPNANMVGRRLDGDNVGTASTGGASGSKDSKDDSRQQGGDSIDFGAAGSAETGISSLLPGVQAPERPATGVRVGLDTDNDGFIDTYVTIRPSETPTEAVDTGANPADTSSAVIDLLALAGVTAAADSGYWG